MSRYIAGLVHSMNFAVRILPQCTLMEVTVIKQKNLISRQFKIIIKCITYIVDITCLYNNIHFNLVILVYILI